MQRNTFHHAAMYQHIAQPFSAVGEHHNRPATRGHAFPVDLDVAPQIGL